MEAVPKLDYIWWQTALKIKEEANRFFHDSFQEGRWYLGCDLPESQVEEITAASASKANSSSLLGSFLKKLNSARHPLMPPGTSAADPDRWRKAQLMELNFWRNVAKNGFGGEDPRTFPLWQRILMTGCFLNSQWDLYEFQEQSVVEIGCGPLGMIEFIPARRKVAYDPLNGSYEILFGKVRDKTIAYYSDLRNLEKQQHSFDLAICWNVLDHTDLPRPLFDLYMNLVRPGGKFLFQLNLVKEGEEQSAEHRAMHPSPFTREKIIAWLNEYSDTYQSRMDEQATPVNEYYFMAWGTTRS